MTRKYDTCQLNFKNELLYLTYKYILISTKNKEVASMYNYYKSFFTETKAEAFIEQLKKQGIEDIELTSARDGFGQTQYRVGWNK